MEQNINELWQLQQQGQLPDTESTRQFIKALIQDLNEGKRRIAEKIKGAWVVNEDLKKAILLNFRLSPLALIEGELTSYYDKIPLKCRGWTSSDYEKAGFRHVPGAVIRFGAYIAPNTVIMPSFINIGAYIDTGTMVDSAVTVGSCAQIGKNCHLSDRVSIGGVLEPLQAAPVIIEDNCFIGAGSIIVEGIHVEEGAVLATGVHLSASTKILDRETGEISYGKIPAYSVVVPGMIPSKNSFLQGAIIVKRVDADTRKKTTINELLRS